MSDTALMLRTCAAVARAHERGAGGMVATTESEPIRGLVAHNQRIADKRKLAVGRAILAAGGPITGTAVLGATRACGVPAESPFYPNTLRQFGFLAQVPGKPTRWTLTPAGVAFVEARKEVVL